MNELILHQPSKYKLNSANAILCGLDEMLNEAGDWGISNNLVVIRYPNIITYSEIPSLFRPSKGTVLYLFQTDDITSEKLLELKPEVVRKIFDPFDTVEVLCRNQVLGKPFDTNLGVKEYGTYQGSLNQKFEIIDFTGS